MVGRRTHPLQILGSCRFPASAKEYLSWRTAPGNPPATVSASFWRAISVRASRLWVFARARRPVARDAIGLFRSATAGDVPAFRGRRIGSRVALLPLWGLPAVSDRGAPLLCGMWRRMQRRRIGLIAPRFGVIAPPVLRPVSGVPRPFGALPTVGPSAPPFV